MSERPLPSGPFAREIAALAGTLEPSNLMLLERQEERPVRYPASPDGVSVFPPSSFAEVRAFAMHFADDGQQLLDSFMNGCEHPSLAHGGRALASDGRLCPSVDKRSVRLNAEQIARLVRLVAAPRPSKLRHCGFAPRHAFVFYDSAGAPVADVGWSFHCSKWSLSGAEPVDISQETSAELRALCTELGLPGCSQATPEREQALRDAYVAWYGSGAPPRPSRLFGIDPSRPLASLSQPERLALCAWRAIELKDWRFDRIEENDPSSRMLESLQTCVERFPECSLPLGIVEQTDFRRASGGAASFAAPPACLAHWLSSPLRACLWGLNTAALAEK